MPIRFNPKTRKYERNGKPVPYAEVRSRVLALQMKIAKRLRRISKQLNDGKITPQEWEAAVKETLKTGHLAASALGKGGVRQLDNKDLRRIEKKLKWQYGFLAKFRKTIMRGRYADNPERIVSRSASYASSVYAMYENTRFDNIKETDGKMRVRLVINSEEGCAECAEDADEGWMPADDMGEIGSRICGDFCKCTIEFEDEL
jgi:hypothetical protein